MGWGPERETFTMKHPADYVTFNSITDNVALGDERNFVRIRDISTKNPYRDDVFVSKGGIYEVYIYFHNDAKSSLNKSGAGIAKDVRITSALSSWKVNNTKKVTVSALLKSTNANPSKIWDSCTISTESESDINLKYVPDSLIIHSAYPVDGTVLNDSELFSSTGVLIGEENLDGIIPACAEHSGYITYQLSAN